MIETKFFDTQPALTRQFLIRTFPRTVIRTSKTCTGQLGEYYDELYIYLHHIIDECCLADARQCDLVVDRLVSQTHLLRTRHEWF